MNGFIDTMKSVHVYLFTLIPAFVTILGLNGKHFGTGPLFILQPQSTVEFLHSNGAVIDCLVHGDPVPEVTWITETAKNTPVNNIPGLLTILPNNSLLLKSFKSPSYRQEIHSTIYRCKAANKYGVIISNPVHVKGVVDQEYRTQVYDEYVILGNTAVLRCNIPSYISDFVEVTSWIIDDDKRISTHHRENSRYNLVQNGNLYIQDVNTGDAASVFKCVTKHRLTKQIRTSSKSGRLYITNPSSSIPPKIVDHTDKVTGRKGEWVVLSCAAQGFPAPKYSWCKQVGNDCLAINADLKTKKQISGILFLKINIEDSGTYSCRAENNVGEDKRRCQLIVFDKMTVFVNPQTQMVKIGQKATLECVITGDKMLERFINVQWVKDGNIIISSNKRIITGNRIEFLTIDNDSRGMYQCFVQSPDEVLQATAEIKLESVQPTLLEIFKSDTLQPGPSIKLKCSASGDPLPRIKWTFADQMLSGDERMKINDRIDDEGNVVSELEINELKVNDGGLYACIASNKAGDTSHSGRINIYGGPFVWSVFNETVVLGDNFSLQCHVSGYPIQTLYWSKDGKILRESDHVTIRRNGTISMKATKHSSGQYTCTATQNGHNSEGHGWVKVLQRPKLNPWAKITTIEVGNTLMLVCIVHSGDKPIKFKWLKDDMEMSHHLGATITRSTKSSTLEVERAKVKHAGNYSCEAENVAGNARISMMVQIRGPPKWKMEPYSLSISSGEASRILCEGQGYPKPSTKWIKTGGQDIRNTTYTTNYKNGTLVIHGTYMERDLQYVCSISNGIAPNLMKSIDISIKRNAVFTQNKNTVTTSLGEVARMRCSVTNAMGSKIYWMRNSTVLSSASSRLDIKTSFLYPKLVSVLSIQSAKVSDAGKYVCVVENGNKKDRKIFTLHIRDYGNDKSADLEPPKNKDIYSQNSNITSEDFREGENNEFLGIAFLYIIPTSTAAVVLLIVLVIVCILLKRQTSYNKSVEIADGNASKERSIQESSVAMKSMGTFHETETSKSHLDYQTLRYHPTKKLQSTGSDGMYALPDNDSVIQPYATFTSDKTRKHPDQYWDGFDRISDSEF